MKGNQWDRIWKKRSSDIELTDNVFENFCNLKRADGFDVHAADNYYQNFYNEYLDMFERIAKNCNVEPESIYEVGCGSGVNLYLFEQLNHIKILGGIDYSANLIEIAQKVVTSKDLQCDEAIDISVNNQYDVVLSDSVFQYFETEEYGFEVFEKMFEKAKKMVVVKEIHDKAKEKEHLAFRRKMDANYDENYKNLGKTFYERKKFEDFAKKHGCRYEITRFQNESYWNNDFVFDFYLYK